MTDARAAGPPQGNPAACRHRCFRRVGIQRAPVHPFRLYLLTCRDCGTTLTTQTVRGRREAGRTSPPAGSAPEEHWPEPPSRRRAG